MKNKLVLIVMSLAAFFATAVYAGGPEQTPTPYNQHQGFYIGGNVGGSYVVGRDSAGNTDVSFWGFAVSGLLGYQFNPYIGLEGGVLYSPNIFNGAFNLSADLMVYYLALKGILPLGDRFNLFGKIGPALFSAEGCVNIAGVKSNCSTNYYAGPYVSVGLGFAVTQNLELTLETGGVIPITQNLSFLGNVLAGFIYHFAL